MRAPSRWLFVVPIKEGLQDVLGQISDWGRSATNAMMGTCMTVRPGVKLFSCEGAAHAQCEHDVEGPRSIRLIDVGDMWPKGYILPSE